MDLSWICMPFWLYLHLSGSYMHGDGPFPLNMDLQHLLENTRVKQGAKGPETPREAVLQ